MEPSNEASVLVGFDTIDSISYKSGGLVAFKKSPTPHSLLLSNRYGQDAYR